MFKIAGIGSRETPEHILRRFRAWGEWFADSNFLLRSGHAIGADRAFEEGYLARNQHNRMRIFVAEDARNRPDWHIFAAKFHPAWNRSSEYAKLLHARNGPIVLGDFLNDPVDLVCCWTKDGRATGGTGQALRIAEFYKIPVFNWYYDDCEAKLIAWLELRKCKK